MKLLVLLSILIGFSWQNSFATEVSCTNLETDFVPFSSSYLPIVLGPLTEIKPRYYMLMSSHRFNRESYLGNSKKSERAFFNSTSTLRRLDLATKEILGKSTTYEKNLRERMLKRTAKFWEGYCNRWTAAAQNEELNKFLNSYKGLKCNGTIITRGEIEEIYTSSYLYFAKGFIGTKMTRKRSRLELSLATLLGIDDLFAHEMDDLIRRNLSVNKALGFDAHPLLQVWNHPIYKSKRCQKNISSSENELIDNTPIKFLMSSNIKLENLLRRVEELDESFFELISESTLEVSVEAIVNQLALEYKDISSEIQKIANLKLFSRTHLVSSVVATKRSLRKLFKEGLIKLKAGHEVISVENRLGYKVEDYYGQDERLEGDSEDLTKYKTFKYSLVKYKGRIVGSKWITPSTERPDYMSSAIAGTIKLPIIKDLEELIRSCDTIL